MKAIEQALRRARQRSRFNHRKTRFTSPADLRRSYAAGFIGAEKCPEVDEIIRGAYSDGASLAHQYGIADSAKGKLVIPFVHVMQAYASQGVPLPGPAQSRGDCVSHSTKNAGLLTLCCEVAAGKPDEVSGRIEGLPKVSDEAVKQGVLSTEAIYWWRDHGGDGWHCGHAAKVTAEESGLWPRMAYDEFGFDLTRYSGRLAGKWGRSNPPREIKQHGLRHRVRTITYLESFEEVRDYLANGYGISSCGGEGFISTRDENGASSRRGGWAHAMAYIGADDRDVIKRAYGGPLVLIQNSWGKWNGGPRRILGTNIDIPHGAFWARWSDVRRRSSYALSGFDGFPPQKLASWGNEEFMR